MRKAPNLGAFYSTFTAIRDEWNALGQLDPKDATVLNRRFYVAA